MRCTKKKLVNVNDFLAIKAMIGRRVHRFNNSTRINKA